MGIIDLETLFQEMQKPLAFDPLVKLAKDLGLPVNGVAGLELVENLTLTAVKTVAVMSLGPSSSVKPCDHDKCHEALCPAIEYSAAAAWCIKHLSACFEPIIMTAVMKCQ
nr:hypothetical protein [uncultured Cohaesibacter sp.]